MEGHLSYEQHLLWPLLAFGVQGILSCVCLPQDNGVYDEAEALTARLMDFGGPHRDAAKSLMRDIRNARMAKLGVSGL